MKNKILPLCISGMVALVLFATNSFAGTGKVRFGKYTSGEGCSGSGICQIGGAGASVTFEYAENPGTGGTTITLTMTVKYEEAVNSGFIGQLKGGTYIFSGGYPFNHPEDKNTGVPSTFSIPIDYPCTYGPKDENGNIRLIVTTQKLY